MSTDAWFLGVVIVGDIIVNLVLLCIEDYKERHID